MIRAAHAIGNLHSTDSYQRKEHPVSILELALSEYLQTMGIEVDDEEFDRRANHLEEAASGMRFGHIGECHSGISSKRRNGK